MPKLRIYLEKGGQIEKAKVEDSIAPTIRRDQNETRDIRYENWRGFHLILIQ